MRIQGVPEPYVRGIAQANGLVAHRRVTGTFVLFPIGSLWRVEGQKYACRHAYARIIERVLSAYPDAVIDTAITTYDGYDDFLARQPVIEQEADAIYGHRDRCDCTKSTGATAVSTSPETLT